MKRQTWYIYFRITPGGGAPESLDASLFISSEQIVASVFFDDVVEAFDALSELNQNNQQYLPSDQEIFESLDNAVSQDSGSNFPHHHQMSL